MKLSNGNGGNAGRFVVLVAVLLMGLILAGCSKRESMSLAEDSASADQHLPFEAASDKGGISPTGSLTPDAIPAGTPVTIHLRLSLSSASSRSGDPFEAVLDEPIIVRGHTLAPILATFVPKIIWADKREVKTGQLFNKSFHITDSDDIFISPSHLGEFYWNFGWSGVVLGMGFIGVICGWVGARFNMAEYSTVTRILVTVVTIKQLIVGFEGAIAPSYVVWLRSLAAIGILHVIFARVSVVSRVFKPANSGAEVVSGASPDGRRMFPNLLT